MNTNQNICIQCGKKHDLDWCFCSFECKDKYNDIQEEITGIQDRFMN
jgi:predicted nucleic acid-binding Zn ribbon protein